MYINVYFNACDIIGNYIRGSVKMFILHGITLWYYMVLHFGITYVMNIL